MGRLQFTKEFKVEAVRLVWDRGVLVAQASHDLDVHEDLLRNWTKDFEADPRQALPDQGSMKPERSETERLRREVQKLKAQRDILKKSRWLLRQGPNMMFSFVAKHRGIWPVALICEALGVSRSGFYAWLTRSPNERAKRDYELTKEIAKSFLDSDRTYGARRVWHDILATGLSCGLHAIERLSGSMPWKPGHAGGGFLPIWASGQTGNWQRTSSIGSSRPRQRTASRPPTSPTSGRRRAGAMSPSFSTSTSAGSKAGR